MEAAVEKQERGKFYYIGLGLVAPGVAHFSLGRWFRGALFFLFSLIVFLWGVWEILRPLIVSIANCLSDQKDAPIEEINLMYFVRIIMPLLVIWGWSFFDLMKILKQNKRLDNDEDNDEDKNE
jgi:hypothetical protein